MGFPAELAGPSLASEIAQTVAAVVVVTVVEWTWQTAVVLLLGLAIFDYLEVVDE